MTSKNEFDSFALKVLAPLLVLAVVGMFGWVLKVSVDIVRIEQNQKELSNNKATFTRFWRLHGWSRHQINLLRQKQQMELAEWPNLSVSVQPTPPTWNNSE